MESSSSESQGAKHELVHFSSVDIMLNTSLPHLQEVRSLVPLFSEGIPPHWTLLGEHDNIFVDKQQQPSFVAKIRESSSASNVRTLREDEYLKKLSVATHFIRATNAYNSIAAEITLSPVIAAICRSTDATELMHRFGFKQLSYVEPLLGIIDKKTLQKSMLYPFIPGETIRDENEQTDRRFMTLSSTEFLQEMKQLFEKKDIIPTDIGATQFILQHQENNDHLYLIDTEGYYKK